MTPPRPSRTPPRPKHLDLQKDRALTVHWADGGVSVYPIAYLRKMSPSADMRELRAEMARNPLTVLPDSIAKHTGPLTATGAELVGNYAVCIHFSDGHETGFFSWEYLREIDPGVVKDRGAVETPDTPNGKSGPGRNA